MDVDFDVEVYGFAQLRRSMREFEPELFKELNREVRGMLSPIASRAKGYIPSGPPLSGWGRSVHARGSRPKRSVYGKRWEYGRLEWDSSAARSSIVVRVGGKRERGHRTSALWRIESKDAAAVVFEQMGRGKSTEPMVRNIQRRFPADGRVLYKAWDEANGDRTVERDVISTVKRFEAEFDRRLEAGR